MAEVIGSLREDKATHGEKVVLEKLRKSLPNDFTVYVECPLHQPSRRGGRGEMLRYPDFIVLANYGVVVLEVKDWVQIINANKYSVQIRTRGGSTHKKPNPVEDARRFALLLAEELRTVPQLLGDNRKLNVPWGFAAILPNLHMSVITQLRKAWGEAFVLGLPDLESHVASRRFRSTLPFNYMLKKWEMRYVRGVINPSIIVETPVAETPIIMLDEEQEKIVAEPVMASPAELVVEEPIAIQDRLFGEVPAAQMKAHQDDELLPLEEKIILNASVRLVRGVAGSGKSLVLVRRAQYLKAQYPEWRMCVLTYNDRLARSLRTQLKGTGVSVKTFHKLCAGLLKNFVEWKEPVKDAQGWINRHRSELKTIEDMSVKFVSDEIKWIKEMGIKDRETYLQIKRRGRGQRLSQIKRSSIFDVYLAYLSWLEENKLFDWADVPYLVLRGMEEGAIEQEQYDAVLIDEAQDFAPIWIAVLKRVVGSEGGLIFLADDPSQSIYRYYSWREKGVPVVGRTRWLRIPYRNTKEIFEAAYRVIADDPILKQSIDAQTGLCVEPDLASEFLRTGPKPELRCFSSFDEEMQFIRMEIERLLLDGYDPNQIVVLHRRTRGVRQLSRYLRGLEIEATTFHKFKGLEFDVVLLSQLQECFAGADDMSPERLSEEKRLVYMAMTRARQKLYVNHEGRWPRQLSNVIGYIDQVVV